MASYAEQQAERQRIKAMQEKQRAKSAAAHQQRVDANAEAKRRQQQQTNQIRAQEAQQAQQQQRLRAQRESERRKNAAARQIEIEQARAKEKSMRIDPAIPDSAYDIPRESDMSYSARLKAHEKKVERARQEDARRARLGLEPRMYIPEFWTPPPKPGSIEALPIPLVPIVPREGQIRAKTVAPQQSRAAVVADETFASIGQGQQQTPTKPPPTAEDLEIARDKAQIQAREAQQKLDNPNVATPRNREYQDIEKQQQGTLGQRVLPALPPPSDEPRRRRRLQGEILEQQQQRTLGRQKWHALPPTEPMRPNPPSRIIEQQQLGTLGQTSRATMQSLQPDPRAKAARGQMRSAHPQPARRASDVGNLFASSLSIQQQAANEWQALGEIGQNQNWGGNYGAFLQSLYPQALEGRSAQDINRLGPGSSPTGVTPLNNSNWNMSNPEYRRWLRGVGTDPNWRGSGSSVVPYQRQRRS